MSVWAQTSDGESFDAVVVGGGFGGLYALHRLRSDGLRVRVLEADDGIGGTWYRNCYPGARCDVESFDYSYSFDEDLQQEWSWSERYASQPEILSYANHVADRFDLRRDIQLNTRVIAATFKEETCRWDVELQDGARVSATYLVLASGCLSAEQVPDIPGLDDFEGEWFHTSRWPREEVRFEGRRVGVVGTGSTGIQVMPEIAERADHVHVFQRTPNYAIPSGNRPADREAERRVKERYAEYRRELLNEFLGFSSLGPVGKALETSEEDLRSVLRERWAHGGGPAVVTAYLDTMVNADANHLVAEFVREQIREIVSDADTAELLSPRDYPLGAKRICNDLGYYEAFNRDNVSLVDVRSDPIECITATGIRTGSAEYELDTIVFATGFDALTGAALAIDIRGRGGVSLRDHWLGGPRTFLGLMTHGFPNLFHIAAAGGPAVMTNVILAIELNVDFVADAIGMLRERGLRTIEPSVEAEDGWCELLAFLATQSMFGFGGSWYWGANIPGKPRVFMPFSGGVPAYLSECEHVVSRGYAGFMLDGEAAPEWTPQSPADPLPA